jgi:hypothetical protein
MLPHNYEAVAQERMRSWEEEIHQRQLLAQLPRQPAAWRLWTGGSLVWLGTWLMRWGARVTPRECRQGVSVTS